MRRIVMRYVCLCLTMVLSNVSPRVKKRFPTLQHLVEAGKLIIQNNPVHISATWNFLNLIGSLISFLLCFDRIA